MSANAAAKKQKPLKRHPSKLKKMSAYMILTLILISIVAVLFAFPLYWIITGSFKTGAAINATTPTYYCGSNYMYDTGSTSDGSRYFGICTGDYF